MGIIRLRFRSGPTETRDATTIRDTIRVLLCPNYYVSRTMHGDKKKKTRKRFIRKHGGEEKKIKTRGHTRKHTILRYVFNGREKLTLFRTSMLQLRGDCRRLVKTNITRIAVYCWLRIVVTGNRYASRQTV